MKVSELIEQLQCMDQDADVHFAYNYGDHWHTVVAPKVSNVSEGYVQFSAYHDMDRIADDEDLDESDSEARQVVIID